MTKRAALIIALLMIVPVALTVRYYREWKTENEVVAQYGGTVGVILYDGNPYYAVPNPEGEAYRFRFGEYLGKVDDALFGASLYRVRDDATGKYLAIGGKNGGTGTLFTLNGELYDGARRPASGITRIVFDEYRAVTDDEDEVRLIVSAGGGEGKSVTFKPSKYSGKDGGGYREFVIRACYDGSAVCTGTYGRLIFLNESRKWIYIGDTAWSEAEEAYADSPKNLEYKGTRVEDINVIRLFQRLLLEENTAETADRTEETTASGDTSGTGRKK